MSDNFEYCEWRIKQNIKKYRIPNVEKYFCDLTNIEYSLSGRIGIPLTNTFIKESVQLVVNSINLFEMGYFDCAYYSLREAIEALTTTVYLADINENKKNRMLEKWIKGEYFPMQCKMLDELYRCGMVISNMKEEMSSFFEEIKIIAKKINKCIHKQGKKFLYISRNSIWDIDNNDEEFIKEYIFFLEKTIRIIAVMRLAIDPYPILLMDEEILLRCFDSMTSAYKSEFVEKYITDETLQGYKKTEIYINYYNSHIEEEKKNYAVFNIMKYQVIDTTKKEEILSQIFLLYDVDIIATYIAFSSNKVVKIYAHGGIQMYVTDRQTNRKAQSWCSIDFQRFKKCDKKFNQEYDEAFIFVFKYKIKDREETFFVEHNVELNKHDIDLISGVALDKL